MKLDHKKRRSGFGGSDAAAALGLSKYRSPLEVQYSKWGLTEPGEQSEPAYWGTRLEPVILEEFAKREGKWVLGYDKDDHLVLYAPDGAVRSHRTQITKQAVQNGNAELMGFIRHPVHDFMIGHMDGIVLEPPNLHGPNWYVGQWKVVGGVDAKTTSAFKAHEWGDEGSDRVPSEYLLQVQHYDIILVGLIGYPVPFHIPALIGGQRWKVFDIEYSEKLAENIIRLEKEAWQMVLDEEPASPSPGDNIGVLYPEADEEKILEIDSGHEVFEMAARSKVLEERIKSDKEELDLLDNQIQMIMKDSSKVKHEDGWSIIWVQTKGKLAWKALAQHLLNKHGYGEGETEALKENNTGKEGRLYRRYLKNLEIDDG